MALLCHKLQIELPFDKDISTFEVRCYQTVVAIILRLGGEVDRQFRALPDTPLVELPFKQAANQISA